MHASRSDIDPTPRHTLRRLGWPAMVRSLAERARTALGRETAEAIAPLPDTEAVLARLARIGEVRAVHRLGEDFPLGGTPDVRGHLYRAEKQGVLEGAELREVAVVLRVASDVRRFVDARAALAAGVREDLAELGGLDGIARRIEDAIEPSGEVSDRASPALADARSRVRRLHERLRRSAEELVHAPDWQDRLQEAYFTVRGDRYVLPIKAAHRYQVGGIVHNVSNTGQTVFIEPPALVEAGNELALAAAEAAEEERRVLRELTAGVGREAGKIRDDLDRLGHLDFLEACARVSDALDASVPEVPGPGAVFTLKGLRHPLLVLQGKKVVRNDVRLEGEARCLVVSGPNAGGKTVTITAVALSAVMLRHGLPIPAEPGSILPLYRAVRAVSGDEQDLERDLSTFTAHLTELKALFEAAGPDVLLLVDEIAADTDPREGAALAVAVLENLLDRGAQALVTTHLEALKALAASDPRFLAAAVGFDVERMQPTYRLRLKASAGSSALEVAARVGLPRDVLEQARLHLSGDAGTLARVLRDLETRQAEAEAEAQRLRQAEAQVQQARAALEAEREKLAEARRALRLESQRELLADVEAARGEVKEMIARLQAQPVMRDAGEAERLLQQRARDLQVSIARQEETETPEQAAEAPSFSPGDFVRIPSMNDREGQILEVGDADALVALGALKMRLSQGDLVPLRRAPRKAVEARMATPRGERMARAEAARGRAEAPAADPRVDLRGLRVEDGLQELERRLDRLFAEGAQRALVVHGHGTGAMRRAVHEFLRAAPYVTGVRPGDRHEGGEGVTVVDLG